MTLGRWGLLDIETTGIDPNYDQIIDIGFLEFDGTELIRKHSSLVFSDNGLSQFIQNLTGITPAMVKNAPQWKEQKAIMQELAGFNLVAHNAQFETNFLMDSFDELGSDHGTNFVDSIPFCALLFPQLSSLGLEKILIYLKLADSEVHRGYEDSRDLLKVLLMGVALHRLNPIIHRFLSEQLEKLEDYWFKDFYQLDLTELEKIAASFNFDLDGAIKNFLTKDENEVLGDLNWDNLEFNSKTVANVLRDEERIGKIIPHYKWRESQEKMSLRVGQAFNNGIHAMVEAPTGTGKTLGYLLPSFLISKSQEKQVLVATATKALQEQAYTKDIPRLKKILGKDFDDFKVTRLIGSKNHYCELLFRSEEDSLDLDFDQAFSKVYFELIFFYNSIVTQGERKLRIHSPGILKRFFEHFRTWDYEYAVDFRSCMSHQCPHKDSCSYFQGLQEAKEADMIIGNHALMFHWPRSIDYPENIIVDEGHKLEEEVTSAFSFELSERELKRLTTQINLGAGVGSLLYLIAQEEEGGDKKMRDHLRDFFSQKSALIQDDLNILSGLMEAMFKKRPRYTSMYWNEVPMINSEKSNSEVDTSILNCLNHLKKQLQDCYEKVVVFENKWTKDSEQDDSKVLAIGKFENFLTQLSEAYHAMDSALQIDNTLARSLKFKEDFGFVITCSPIDIGKIVKTELMEKAHSTVITSATLSSSVDGTRGIEWASGHLYLDSAKRFSKIMSLPPVFDYGEKAKVFISHDTPSMHQAEFIPKTLKEIMPMVEKLGGKTLLLYSSRARYEKAREVVYDYFQGKIPVFAQGLGSKIVDDFMASENGILMGMESLSEGIDIPGDKLKFIYIDKVPDLRQDLVIQERREFYAREFGNEFVDYFLATRARKLLQKLGRLLRTEHDTGAILITDSRLSRWKGRTLAQFMSLLQPYKPKIKPFHESIETIAECLLQEK